MNKFIKITSITPNSQTFHGHPNFFESEGIPTVYASCPDCAGDIVKGIVSCPDQRWGCCVAHCGYGCMSCKKSFDIIGEYKNPPINALILKEEIGIGIINPRALSKLRKL